MENPDQSPWTRPPFHMIIPTNSLHDPSLASLQYLYYFVLILFFPAVNLNLLQLNSILGLIAVCLIKMKMARNNRFRPYLSKK